MGSRITRVIALVAALHLGLLASGALAETPKEAVRGVVDEVMRILNDPALKGPAGRSRRLDLITQAITTRFDFREMAKRSLAAQWTRLSPAQRDEFVSLFKSLLQASYADKFDKYQNEKVAYTGENQDDGYAEVRVVVLRANDRIPLSFRLLQEDSRWMVYDVVIEGVGLVSNYRSQFSRVIRESSYGELVKRLQAKVREDRAIKGL